MKTQLIEYGIAAGAAVLVWVGVVLVAALIRKGARR
jgi:hypothetical protein